MGGGGEDFKNGPALSCSYEGGGAVVGYVKGEAVLTL